jgi:hypothetical protein
LNIDDERRQEIADGLGEALQFAAVCALIALASITALIVLAHLLTNT